MNKIMTTVALMGLVLGHAVAEAENAPGMQQGMKGMKGMGGMHGMMQMSDEQRDAHMRAMQEHMLMMHDYSNRILSEQDPEKKQKLKDEQLDMMKAHHKQMKQHRQKMMQMKRDKMQKKMD